MFHTRLTNSNTQEQREKQRRSYREQETENSTKNCRESQFHFSVVILRSFLCHHLNSTEAFGNQQFYQVRIASIRQAQIKIGNHRNRNKEMFCQCQRSKQHHWSVGSTHHSHRCTFFQSQAKSRSNRYCQESAQLCAQSQEYTCKWFLKQEADIQKRPDTHKDKTSYQPVTKRQGINRLQEIYLHSIH